jgi:hypothetical protein
MSTLQTREYPKLVTASASKTPLFTSSGRCAGVVYGDKLRKTCRRSVHFLRSPLSIGFDVAVLEQARALGVRVLVVEDLDRDVIYTATVETFDRHSFPVSRGHGEQRALPLACWHVRDPLQPELFDEVTA